MPSELPNPRQHSGPLNRRSFLALVLLSAAGSLPARAQRSLDTQARQKGRIHTQIRRLERFYRAEDYHQKYTLRGFSTHRHWQMLI